VDVDWVPGKSDEVFLLLAETTELATKNPARSFMFGNREFGFELPLIPRFSKVIERRKMMEAASS
jgi:hypothetical protein